MVVAEVVVLCVSPLTTWMMDQQGKFRLMGICTDFVAEQSDEEAVKRVINGQSQLVYISPERIIGNHNFSSMLLSLKYKKNLVAFVMDEAHCVKTWLVPILYKSQTHFCMQYNHVIIFIYIL